MRVVLWLGVVALAASCGSTGGDRTPSARILSDPAGQVSPVFSTRSGMDALNGFRSKNGRPPVSISPQLEAAARAHAADMARRGFFDHSGSDGSNPMTRVRRTGYSACFIAENIARGQRSLAEVMESWAGSSGHRKNMLSPNATEFGLVRGEGDIWVMVLGSRC